MFSVTTIASSTTKPVAIVSSISYERMFTLKSAMAMKRTACERESVPRSSE